MNIVAIATALVGLLGAPAPQDKPAATVQIRLPESAPAEYRAIFERQIQDRSGAKIADGGLEIVADVDATLGFDGFRIEDTDKGAIRISGQSPRAILYGLGKLLRTSRYSPEGFTPGTWRGTSVPEKPVRGIYFASHFHNFYQDAPIPVVARYVEDLALWGTNNICVWFDMHEFMGIEDPKTQAMIERLKTILAGAKGLGLDTTLLILSNEAFKNSPEELRADYTIGHDGYTAVPQGNYPVDVCPSKPGGLDYILKTRKQVLDGFSDAKIDSLIIWPYDQGGCTCANCAPWGTNGFLKCAKPIGDMLRAARPDNKIILSTWYFDHFTKGEWEGLKKMFAEQKPEWVDYLMVGDMFEIAPLKAGVPGGVPVVTFPEISMYGVGGWGPWGGFGASPYPTLLEQRWKGKGQYFAGGFPYSEGIFEDMNKALYSQFFWDGKITADEAIRNYAAFEYSPDVAEDVLKVVKILEKTLIRVKQGEGVATKYMIQATAGVTEALKTLQAVDARLTPQAKTAWRWRILFLRAVIDKELSDNKGAITDRADEAFQELTKIYHAEGATFVVAPPSREALKANRQF